MRNCFSALVIGGASFSKEKGCLKSIEEVSVEDGDSSNPRIICKVVGELNEPRRSPSVLSRNREEAWIMGGCSAEGSHLTTVELLTKKANVVFCTAVDSTVKSHSCAGFCSVNNTTGYVVGGYDGLECLRDLAIMDLHNGVVRQTLALPSRFKNTCCVSDCDDVLILGGWDEKETSRAIFRLTLKDNTYDIAFEALLPLPLEGHSCSKTRESIFITGGFDGVEVVNSICRYDLKKKSCEPLPVTLNTARENHVSVVFNDRFLLVIGGWDGKQSLSSIELFYLLEKFPYLERFNGEFRLTEPRNRPSILTL